MPRITPNFKLEHFHYGSTYSSDSDKRRFITLDYNLQSYIGVVGVGVLSGWVINNTSNVNIEITPGKGIINGFFAESPYVIKKRTQMASGEREIEIIRYDDQPEPYMTSQEIADYQEVIRAYNPSFSISAPVENVFVKVSTAHSIELPDNSDLFIYGELPTAHTPYPKLVAETAIYDSLVLPVEEDYEDFATYFAALQQYETDLASYVAMKWQDDPENHFTAVEFSYSTTRSNSANKLYLGKVKTRSGSVSKIDSTGVDSLENMSSVIQKKATEIIKAHKHGGAKRYDPPKINLETDIRDAALYEYNYNSGIAIYKVLDKNYTSINQFHKHSYIIDGKGNGQTIEHIGSGPKHFHKIVNYKIINNENTYSPVESHTHTIKNTSKDVDMWDDDSLFNVYIGNRLIGNQDSSNITLSASKTDKTKTISISSGNSLENKMYSCSFSAYSQNYEFSSQEVNVHEFAVKMFNDYYNKFSGDIARAPNESVINADLIQFIRSPSGAASANSNELYNQCAAATKALTKTGDKFLLVAPVAKDLEILLKLASLNVPEKVKVEVLLNSEVSGILGVNNILYLHADKLISGTFDIARIPFISHTGRMRERFAPVLLPILSKNGKDYKVLPRYTTDKYGHYHDIYVDYTGNGYTLNTYIGDEIIDHEEIDGQTYNVSHSHVISNWQVASEESEDIAVWITKKQGESVLSHAHELLMPSRNAGTAIYSICEDANLNIYMGTSNGVLVKPSDKTYLFAINSEYFYSTGSTLLDALQQAITNYQKKTGQPISISDEYVEVINNIEDVLVEHGSTYNLKLPSTNKRIWEDIIIQYLHYVSLNRIDSVIEKKSGEVGGDDLIGGIKLYKKSDKKEIDIDDPSIPDILLNNNLDIYYNVLKDNAGVPVTNMTLKFRESVSKENQQFLDGGIITQDVMLVSGPDVLYQYDIEERFDENFIRGKVPSQNGIIRKADQCANGDIWLATESGLYVNRKEFGSFEFQLSSTPGTSDNFYDVICINNTVVVASKSGIYSSSDGGKTWTTNVSSEFGFKTLLKDETQAITNTTDHYHTLEVDLSGNGVTSVSSSGPAHTHTVSNWTINETLSHTHTIITQLWAIDGTGNVFVSTDGNSFSEITKVPDLDFGRAIAFGNVLLIGTASGVYKYDIDWTKISNEVALSFCKKHDLSGILIGTYNCLFESSDLESLEELISFVGGGQPLIRNDSKVETFNYAFSNKENKIYFNDSLFEPKDYLAQTDYTSWAAENGAWINDSKYDLYYNGKIVTSTRTGFSSIPSAIANLSIIPATGGLSLKSQTETLNSILPLDTSFNVVSTAGFNVGDTVVVWNDTPLQLDQVNPLSTEITYTDAEEVSGVTIESRYNDLARDIVAQNAIIENNNTLRINHSRMLYIGKVIEITPNSIAVNTPFVYEFSSGCNVEKCMESTVNTTFTANIYDSPLVDAGKLTHQEIDDALSKEMVGPPYRLANSYLSNILQLTQAVKYAYPDIDAKMHNIKLYDMHYSSDVLASNYIGNFIDTENSELHAPSEFEYSNVKYGAKKINDIVIGHGDFSGVIFVATDVGLFYGKYVNSRESNWWYCPSITFAVYKVLIKNDFVVAAGTNGLYKSQDLTSWVKMENGAVKFSILDASKRWDDYNVLSLTGVSVSFDNIIVSGKTKGVITATTGIFGDFEANKTLFIDATNATTKNGTYIIESVSPETITITSSFTGSVPESDTSVNISMSAWWEAFSADNASQGIKNPYVIAGVDGISYSFDPLSASWNPGKIEGITDQYSATSLTPLKSGAMAAVVNANSGDAHIIKTTDFGATWTKQFSFDVYSGSINSKELSSDGHTILNVNFDNNIYLPDGSLQLNKLQVIANDLSIYATFEISWNYTNDTGCYISLYGQDTTLPSNYNMFRVLPSAINTLLETKSEEILAGTSRGIIRDNKTFAQSKLKTGSVVSVGRTGKIVSIDTTGKVQSTFINENGNIGINLSNISASFTDDELKGASLFTIDDSPPKRYVVAKNKLINDANTLYIEIDHQSISEWNAYIGKNVSLALENSTINVVFDQPTSNGGFSKGYFIMGNGNILYSVSYNSSNKVFLSGLVDWARHYDYLRAGGDFFLINSKMDLELVVDLESLASDYALNGFFFVPENSKLVTTQYPKIKTNVKNKVVLGLENVLGVAQIKDYITKGDKFSISGVSFEPCVSFQSKSTNVNLDHYHDIALIDKNLEGVIQEIENNIYNGEYVDISISAGIGFDSWILGVDKELLSGEYVYIYNLSNPNISYTKKIKSIIGNVIRVFAGTDSDWNYLNDSFSMQDKISQGWKILVDAKTYGITTAVNYMDFIERRDKIIENIDISDVIIHVQDSSLYSTGDKIAIVGRNKSEIAYIESVIDSNRIQVVSPISKLYSLEEGGSVYLLKDTYGNNHSHKIRKNRIEFVDVSDYFEIGYPKSHSHQVYPFIKNVLSIIEGETDIFAAGESKKIYVSSDGAASWKQKIDLSKSDESLIENENNITVTKMIYDDGVIAGATNGHLYFQNHAPSGIEQLIYPKIN